MHRNYLRYFPFHRARRTKNPKTTLRRIEWHLKPCRGDGDMTLAPRTYVVLPMAALIAFMLSLTLKPSTAVATSKPLTIERLYSLPWVTGSKPLAPTWARDSEHLAFLWNNQGTNFYDVWVTDVKHPTPVRVTSFPQPSFEKNPGKDIELLRTTERAETDHGVDAVAWEADGRHLLLSLHGSLYRVLPGEAPQKLDAGEGEVSDPAVAPRSGQVAYRCGDDLCVMSPPIGMSAARKVFVTGRAKVTVEEFHWSLDGTKIAFIETDSSQVRTRAIPDYLETETRLNTVIRPFPGEASELRRVGILDLKSQTVRWAEIGRDPMDSIFSIAWSPDSRHLLVDKSDLYIKDRRLLLVDAQTGQSSVLVHEVDPRNVTAEWWADFSPNGRGIYFISDRDEDYHLYYQALDSTTAQRLTSGPYAVFSAAACGASSSLLFVSNQSRPENRQVWMVTKPGSKPALITPEPGAHHPVPSPNGAYLADLYSNDVTPQDLYIRPIGVSQPAIQVTHSPLPEFKDYAWVAARYVEFPNVNDGTVLHARLTLPANFDPQRKYPAILGSVYSNTVHNEWGGRIYHPTWGLDQFLAQSGYVIMNVDISGSSGHGKAFRQRIREDYGGVDVDDLYSGVVYLTQQGYVDPHRVGIWGSSYGGLLTTMSLFRKPGVYKAGVAGAPATSLFHAETGEMRTMMAPQDHAEQYAHSSAFLRSGELKDHLMLIHGMRDDVVLFKDSVTLQQRLILQENDIDFLMLPNSPHGWDTLGLAQTRYAFRKLVGYFDRYLKEPSANP